MADMFRRTRLLSQLVVGLPALRRVRRPEHSWRTILDRATTFAGGFLNPLQAPSEATAFLAEVEQLRPRIVLEIGTATGGMFFLLARAAAPDAHLLSLDLPGGLGGGGYAAWKTHVFRRMILPDQRATFIRGDSHAASSRETVREALGGAPIDLLFIDGDHTYEGVRQDFAMYGPLVRAGGMIAFHDIQPNTHPELCGVDRFWQEIKRQHRSHEHVALDEMYGKMGIGVLTVA
jgi:predicted O-methyltransferase YrrM